MAQYIGKSALVAEIKRLIDRNEYSEVYDYAFRDGNNAVCVHILNFLDTLETKEVDWKDERMKDCPYRIVGCERYFGTVTECNGACAWVVDYPKLEELKAKEGE